MTEKSSVLSRPLVMGRKRDGRRCYDPEAKRELIEACRWPGVSVARMALEHGINANLLRKWIGNPQGAVASVTAGHPVSLPAFAPVVSITAPEPTGAALSVTLPNGVKLELRGVGADDLSPLEGVRLSLFDCCSMVRAFVFGPVRCPRSGWLLPV